MDCAIPYRETRYPVPWASSSLFTLLYCSLLYSQRHAPRTTKDILPKYDYIIVGAGSAGSTLASRLSEMSCVNVLLLEAGKSPPVISEVPVMNRLLIGTDIFWGYFTTPQKHVGRLTNNRVYPYLRGKVIGGTSVINSMLYTRGHPYQYDEWEALGASGWSYEKVLPYFKKAEMNRNPESIENLYHGFQGPLSVENTRFHSPYKSAIEAALMELGYHEKDYGGPKPKGSFHYQSTTAAGQRCSTAKAYLLQAENRTNLHIVENALVTKIIIQNKKAIGIEFSMDFKSFIIEATEEVILSAGVINTPQLLMLSGIGPRQHLSAMGIPVIADLPVGMNLRDHIGGIHLYYTNKLPSSNSDISNPENVLQYINKRTGPLAIPGGFQYTIFQTNDRNSPDNAVPDFQLYFNSLIATTLTSSANMKQKVYDQIIKPHENSSIISCISSVLNTKSVGSVKLRSADAFDSPLINPNYLAHPKDLRDIMEGLKECDRIVNTDAFKSLGLKPIEAKYPGCEMYERYSEEYLICEIKSLTIPHYHATGTSKMGDFYDPTTVVDSELRVKGIHGLRVVDASVMPTMPSGNPNAPIIMIAEKAADIIKENLACSLTSTNLCRDI